MERGLAGDRCGSGTSAAGEFGLPQCARIRALLVSHSASYSCALSHAKSARSQPRQRQEHKAMVQSVAR